MMQQIKKKMREKAVNICEEFLQVATNKQTIASSQMKKRPK